MSKRILLTRSDGVKQHYTVSNDTFKERFKGHYSKKERSYSVLSVAMRKSETPRKVEEEFHGAVEKAKQKTERKIEKEKEFEEPDLEDIKEDMINYFGKVKRQEHAGGRFQITNALERHLNEQEPSDEGGGWYQIGDYEQDIKGKRDYRVKIRYNPSQHKLKVILSGTEYYA